MAPEYVENGKWKKKWEDQRRKSNMLEYLDSVLQIIAAHL